MFSTNDSGFTPTPAPFSFELDFAKEVSYYYQWIIPRWTDTFLYSAVYVLVIFGGRYAMEKRPRFDLRRPLVIWSGLLAVFSIVGAARTLPEVIYVLRNYGWNYSVCHQSFYYGPTAFWAVVFALSKVRTSACILE